MGGKTKYIAMNTINSFAALTLISCINITTLFAQNSSSVTKRKTNVELDGLIGSVNQIKQEYFKAQDKFGEFTVGEREGSSLENSLITYGDKGEKLEVNYYKIDGNLFSKTKYKYGENGNTIEINSYKSDGSLNIKTIYKYNAKGNEIESNMIKQELGLTFKWVRNYNDKGEQVEAYYYRIGGTGVNDFKGSADRKYIYTYDEKGNTVEVNVFKIDGSLDSRTTFQYDTKGKLNEENKYKADGTLDTKSSFKYDDNGNKIEAIKYKADGTIDTKNIFKYDDKRNKLEEIKFRANGSTEYQYTYEYKFDKQGNWIKQFILKNNIISNAIIRELKYFGDSLKALTWGGVINEGQKNNQNEVSIIKNQNSVKVNDQTGVFQPNGTEYLGKWSGASAGGSCNCLLSISKIGESFQLKSENDCHNCYSFQGIFIKTPEGNLKGGTAVNMLLTFDKINNQIIFSYGPVTQILHKIK